MARNPRLRARDRKKSCLPAAFLLYIILFINHPTPEGSAEEVGSGGGQQRRDHAALAQSGHEGHDGIVDVCDFKAFENMDLKAYIQTLYSHQIIIENDVNIASIGFSALYPNYQHMVLVYQPLLEYIGCGMIINGTLYDGFTHFAG